MSSALDRIIYKYIYVILNGMNCNISIYCVALSRVSMEGQPLALGTPDHFMIQTGKLCSFQSGRSQVIWSQARTIFFRTFTNLIVILLRVGVSSGINWVGPTFSHGRSYRSFKEIRRISVGSVLPGYQYSRRGYHSYLQQPS